MMVVQRKTGVILHDDPSTEEQRTRLWEKFLEVAALPLIEKMLEEQMQAVELELDIGESPDLDIGAYPLDENAHSGE